MVEYRRLENQDDFDQVGDLQRRVFGFSDLDLLPPPLLRLVARNKPPIGIHLGAFHREGGRSEMVGAVLSFATFLPDTAYIVLLGVLPEYQNGPYGATLLERFRTEALSRGIGSTWGVFDPLDQRLARLYVGNFGFVGTEMLGNKLLFRWDLNPDPRAGTTETSGQEELRFLLPASGPDRQREALAFLEEHLNRKGHVIVDCQTQRIEGERVSHYVLRPTL